MPRERLDTAQYISVQSAHFVHLQENWGAENLCRLQKSHNNTIIVRYPIPHIDDTLYRLRHIKIFSKINLASGYHQVEIHPDYCCRTTF